MMGAGAGTGSRQGLAFSQVCLHVTAVSLRVAVMLPHPVRYHCTAFRLWFADSILQLILAIAVPFKCDRRLQGLLPFDEWEQPT